MVKRGCDIVLSITALALLLPLLILIALLIASGSPGGVFYTQVRVGKDKRLFSLYKFRTMRPGSEKSGQLTVGMKDPRITRTGYFLRKYKLDELPQLLNILKGDMSIVGPRPEVPKYVEMYDPCQLRVLKTRPGLTDYASLAYINENEILGKAADPEKTYIEQIMPAKLELNLKYIDEQSIKTDFHIIWKTIKGIIIKP